MKTALFFIALVAVAIAAVMVSSSLAQYQAQKDLLAANSAQARAVEAQARAIEAQAAVNLLAIRAQIEQQRAQALLFTVAALAVGVLAVVLVALALAVVMSHRKRAEPVYLPIPAQLLQPGNGYLAWPELHERREYVSKR